MTDEYAQGFVVKCAQAGVDPEVLATNAFEPETDFADELTEEELRIALKERVQMIAQLREHRDALLNSLAGAAV